VVVVENAQEPRSSLSSDVERLELPANLGYAGGANAGIERCREAGCDRFVLLNNDVQLEKGCLRRLAEGLEDPELGAVGPVIRRAGDGCVESRGVKLDLRLGRQRLLGHGEAYEPAEGRLAVDSLSGAVMALSAVALERVGGLDETYFHGFEDADWCTRARRAGLELAVIEGAVARHVGEQTLGKGSPVGLYYAARNHLRAVEGLCPLRGPRAWLRRGAIVSLNVAHALLRGPGPRGPRLRAVVAGTADFLRGRFGPRAEVS
jgi:GT2 family glycosyltransferase